MLHLKVVFGRVPAYGGPKTASLDDERVVHIEREDGSSPNTGSPEDFAPVRTPAKMIVPAMTPRMEQRDDPATYGILRRHLDPLEFVARMACQAEVFQRCRSACCFGNDVIDDQSCSADRSWCATIGTAPASLCHQPSSHGSGDGPFAHCEPSS